MEIEPNSNEIEDNYRKKFKHVKRSQRRLWDRLYIAGAFAATIGAHVYIDHDGHAGVHAHHEEFPQTEKTEARRQSITDTSLDRTRTYRLNAKDLERMKWIEDSIINSKVNEP